MSARKLAWVAAAVGMVALALWWLARAGDVKPGVTLTAVPVAASAAGAKATLEGRPASATASASAVLTDADRGTVICGLGRMPQSADPEAQDKAIRARPEVIDARRRIDAALRASPDSFAQAIATWLDPARRLSRPGEREDLLARRAIASADPRVYGLAYRTCRFPVDAASACTALSLRQWAHTDAGNGLSWLYALAEAATRGDAAAQDEALRKMSRSVRIDDRYLAAVEPLVDLAPQDDVAQLAAMNLAIEAIGMYAAQAIPLSSVVAACKGDALDTPDRAPQCARIADLLMDHSDTLLLSTIGGRIDVNLTGRTERLERIKALQTIGSSLLYLPPSMACKPLRKGLQSLKSVAAQGEMGALRAHQRELEASAQPVPSQAASPTASAVPAR